MERQSVRMGASPGLTGTSKRLICIGGGLLVVLAAVALWFGQGESSENRGGCRSDSECRAGSICAGGGCVFLLSGEIPSMWHEDLDAQLNPGTDAPPWTPGRHYGEKLVVLDICFGVEGKKPSVQKKGTNLSLVKQATVYALEGDKWQVYRKKRVRGTQWISFVDMHFDGSFPLQHKAWCHGAGVESLYLEKVAGEVSVTAHLTEAVPVGGEAEAAIMTRLPVGQPDADGLVQLSFLLHPSPGERVRVSSALAIPLGTEISALKGPAPAAQRLLTGFIVYYWEHDAKLRQVEVSLRPPALPGRSLDITEVKP